MQLLLRVHGPQELDGQQDRLSEQGGGPGHRSEQRQAGEMHPLSNHMSAQTEILQLH